MAMGLVDLGQVSPIVATGATMSESSTACSGSVSKGTNNSANAPDGGPFLIGRELDEGRRA